MKMKSSFLTAPEWHYKMLLPQPSCMKKRSLPASGLKLPLETDMKWITRERPKIDRIACPWLIRNFVDKEAQFIFVPKELVLDLAKRLDAIPYDLPGVEYTHEGDRCTFDYIIKKHH